MDVICVRGTVRMKGRGGAKTRKKKKSALTEKGGKVFLLY